MTRLKDKILICMNFMNKLCILYIETVRNARVKHNKKMKAYNGNNFKQQVSFFHQNIPGTTLTVQDQISAVETLLSKLQCDVLIVSEADTKVVCNWDYPGYTAYEGQLKGKDLVRVSALVKNSLKPQVSHLDCEVPNVVISFKINNLQYRVTGCYREWNYGGEETQKRDQEARWCQFEDAWYINNRRCKRSCLLGDMNFDYLGNGTRHQQTLEPIRNSVLDNIVMRGWKQMVDKNTRFAGKQQPACLDHVYYNDVDMVKYHVNKSYTESDHNTVGIVVRTQKFIPEGEDFTSRCWNKVNWNWARYLVRYTGEYHRIFSYSDPNDIVDFLEMKLHHLMDTVAPEQIIKLKPGTAKWMTSYIEDRLEHRDKLRDIWQKSGLPSDERKWRDDKKEVRFLVRRAKQEQVEKDLEIKDLKKRWERVRKITGAVTGGGPPTELVENGVTVKEPAEVAEILNRGFRAKVEGIMERVKADPEEALDMFEDYAVDLEEKNGRKFGEFEFAEVDCIDVRRATISLQNTPSVGTDGIPTIVLKELAWVLAPYIAYLINTIFRTGIFPTRWKEGVITPIHKKGSRMDKLNYRPVTITNAMSKIWEKIVNRQLWSYLNRYRIMDNSQHAYRVGRGTDSYWQDLTSKIVLAKDQGKKVSVSIWDLQSAFNMTQRSILLPKLRRLGFQESSLNLLGAAMSNRKVATKINGVLSSWEDVDVGTYEGGIISPLLFNLSTVDFAAVKLRVEKEAKEGFVVTKKDEETGELVDEVVTAPSLTAEPGVYADDSGYVNSTDTEEELRNAAVLVDKHVVKFFTVNGHSVNVLKTDLLSVLNRFSEPLQVGEVTSKPEIKLLGLKMTEKMSYLPQAMDVVSKISAKLPGILRMRGWAPLELIKRTAESCLVSHISYLLHCYGGERRVQVILQRCLNRIMRGILNREQRSSVEEMMRDLNWLSIPNLVMYKTLFWFRETDRASQAPFTRGLLVTSQQNYHTRRQRLEPCFRPQTMTSSLQFIHRGSSLYNKLDLFPVLADTEDFKELVREKIIRIFGNKNI